MIPCTGDTPRWYRGCTEEGSRSDRGVRNSFVSTYFSHFELFSSHKHAHVLTFAMISPHVLFPLFHFAFTIHTKSEPLRTQQSRFEDLSKEQELSTREALRQAPFPIRSRIARLRQWSASTPTPPQTRDATLYHEESSPRGLPTPTIPHHGMKRR